MPPALETMAAPAWACCWPSCCRRTVRELLVVVQHELFNLGGELSIPGNEQLPRLKEIILPAGTHGAALAYVSRAVARRAERSLVALAAAPTTSGRWSNCASTSHARRWAKRC